MTKLSQKISVPQLEPFISEIHPNHHLDARMYGVVSLVRVFELETYPFDENAAATLAGS